jgi:two-component system sensor kinase FixL
MRNAVEAMKESPTRELKVRTRMSGPGMMTVEVSDSGPGIADDIAANLFQPFTTSKPGGMGIGLSISRHIIRAHGGDLTATRNAAGGATFVFTLPTLEDDADE